MSRTTTVSLLATLLGLIAGAIYMLSTGNDPLKGYFYLFSGGLKSVERIGNTLATATPLIFTGLSVAFAFRTGLFNIGTPGQMLLGGLSATVIALTLDLPKAILLPVILMGSILGGALWGAIPGFLKARFNVHEVVSGIMMNWIAYWVVYYIIPWYFKGEFLETESKMIPDQASLKVGWLSNMFQGSYVNLGLFVAVIAVILCAFILDKTVLGYELKSVGYNRHAAEYAGISVNKNIMLSMMISGALSGLAGASFYVGYASSMQIGVMPSQGLDGIAVSLLGNNSPFGVLASAIFFGLLHSGKGFMNAMTKIPPEIANTIIATIIYFAATSVFIERVLDGLKRRKRGAK
ncbi:MAG: ABC transporter permease [Clostridia bacterium]|nr:ABC transporter permease [Clostridia bacterium]